MMMAIGLRGELSRVMDDLGRITLMMLGAASGEGFISRIGGSPKQRSYPLKALIPKCKFTMTIASREICEKRVRGSDRRLQIETLSDLADEGLAADRA